VTCSPNNQVQPRIVRRQQQQRGGSRSEIYTTSLASTEGAISQKVRSFLEVWSFHLQQHQRVGTRHVTPIEARLFSPEQVGIPQSECVQHLKRNACAPNGRKPRSHTTQRSQPPECRGLSKLIDRCALGLRGGVKYPQKGVVGCPDPEQAADVLARFLDGTPHRLVNKTQRQE
jgi:hypothetical protein